MRLNFKQDPQNDRKGAAIFHELYITRVMNNVFKFLIRRVIIELLLNVHTFCSFEEQFDDVKQDQISF